jgi:hypothetical protein
MPAVLDSTGLTVPDLTEINDEIVDGLLSAFPGLDLTEESYDGQLIGSFADRLAACYELLAEVYAGYDPSQASGHQLHAISARTGTVVKRATKGYLVCSLDLDAGTYAIGSLVANVADEPTKRYENLTEVVSSGGATTVTLTAQAAGRVVVSAATLTEISAAVTGWNSVTNAASSEASGNSSGTNAETDTELRLRRAAELARSGSSTAAAIRADLLEVTGVVSALVVENDTDATVDGIPAHSVACYVRGSAAAADIRAQILASKPAGIQAFGSSTGNVTDEQGETHSIGYTAPSSVRTYCNVSVSVIADTYEGETALKAALVAVVTGDTGKDVIRSKLLAAASNLGGVVDVTALTIDTVDPPVSTLNVTITSGQYAYLDAVDIDVTVTYVTGAP